MATAAVRDTPILQRLEMPSFAPPKHLDPIIYPTGVGVSSVSGREGEQQMLSTAIKVTLDPQKSVKVSQTPTLADRTALKTDGLLSAPQEFLVALRLQGATMRHHMTQANHSWHEQVSAHLFSFVEGQRATMTENVRP